MMRISHISTLALILSLVALLTGCDKPEGTLADYFGWQSLGGTWTGTAHFADSTDSTLKMTFTGFDGAKVHVVVESGAGANYIRNEADADYSQQTKFFTFDLTRFFGGPCWFDGHIVDKYTIQGNLEFHKDGSPHYGYYDLVFPH